MSAKYFGEREGGKGGKGEEGGEGGTYSEDHVVSDAHTLRVPRAGAGVNERREGVPPAFAMRNINGTRVTAAKKGKVSQQWRDTCEIPVPKGLEIEKGGTYRTMRPPSTQSYSSYNPLVILHCDKETHSIGTLSGTKDRVPNACGARIARPEKSTKEYKASAGGRLVACFQGAEV